jgi:NADH-quinone oxidoreductase subunit N
MKRMLAYSSISHSGYMMLAVVAFGSLSGSVLLFYTISYSIATITAFGIVILVREVHGNDHFTSFNGLSRTNPLEAACLTIALLSLTGIPPLAGFIAKYYLFTAAISGGFLWLVIIAIVGSAVSVGYYFRPVIAMYLKDGEGNALHVEWAYKVHLVFMTLLTVVLGIFSAIII